MVWHGDNSESAISIPVDAGTGKAGGGSGGEETRWDMLHQESLAVERVIIGLVRRGTGGGEVGGEVILRRARIWRKRKL